MSDPNKPNLNKWEVLEERTVYECDPWIKLNVQKIKLPNGEIVDDFHHLDMPEYVVIYPVTASQKVIMLKSYRHGVGDITQLFPGGLIDEGETPLDAAKRELLEETGFGGGEWQSMGSYVPHSNYGGGRAHMFKATNVDKAQLPNSGDLEEMYIQLFDPKTLTKMMVDGQIVSMSSVAALLLGEKENILNNI
jgi:ADP-ribose pyrophosphatase